MFLAFKRDIEFDLDFILVNKTKTVYFLSQTVVKAQNKQTTFWKCDN